MIEDCHGRCSLSKVAQRTEFLSLARLEITAAFLNLGGEFSAIPKPDQMTKKFAFTRESSRLHFSLDGGVHCLGERNINDVSHIYWL